MSLHSVPREIRLPVPFTLSWCEGWITLSPSKTAKTRRDSQEDLAKASTSLFSLIGAVFIVGSVLGGQRFVKVPDGLNLRRVAQGCKIEVQADFDVLL